MMKLAFGSVLATGLLLSPAMQAQYQPYQNYQTPAPQAAYQNQDPAYQDQDQQQQAPPTNAAPALTTEQAPPPIPQYDQPEIPGDGYLWTPGYWAWGPGGYYWVNGAWVEPPYVGALWTPGYWGAYNGLYGWYPGYWGRSIGYYGGLNYGFGYFGVGFYGGYWNGGRFWYNRPYGHFPVGFRGGFYNRPWGGYNGRPGGSSFTRTNWNTTGHVPGGGRVSAPGRVGWADPLHNGGTTRNGFANGGNRTATSGGSYYGHSQQGSYNQQPRSFSGGDGGYSSHASAPQHSYSAPSGGGRGFSATSGGGFHGGGGSFGGGSFHGGGGGASHGGGGHR